MASRRRGYNLPGHARTAISAVYARHRLSTDADHVLTDLRQHFDEVLATFEAVVGWTTARIQRPVQILGSLDGIEAGVRQLIRTILCSPPVDVIIAT